MTHVLPWQLDNDLKKIQFTKDYCAQSKLMILLMYKFILTYNTSQGKSNTMALNKHTL